MISIIIPVYNAEACLKPCVESVQSQSITDIEVVLVDDGSTDRSGAIIDDLASKDSRIKTLHKANGGASSARNMGLELAKGEWIGFIDADDEVKHDFLKSFFQLGDDADLLSQGYCRKDIAASKESYHFEPTATIKGNDIMPFVLKTMDTWQLGYIWCKLYRREIINCLDLRFNESYHQCEDLLFNLQYLEGCRTILNTSTADQYLYDWKRPHYKQQDFIAMYFDQYEAMSKIFGAEQWMERIKGIYAHRILSCYILNPSTPYKKKHKERFLSELYSYRDKLPFSYYRKVYRLFLLISYLSQSQRYANWLLGLFCK